VLFYYATLVLNILAMIRSCSISYVEVWGK